MVCVGCHLPFIIFRLPCGPQTLSNGCTEQCLCSSVVTSLCLAFETTAHQGLFKANNNKFCLRSQGIKGYWLCTLSTVLSYTVPYLRLHWKEQQPLAGIKCASLYQECMTLFVMSYQTCDKMLHHAIWVNIVVIFIYSYTLMYGRNYAEKINDPDETRTRNLLIRSQSPYPLGHGANWYKLEEIL